MADYWKSQPKKFCTYCKCWIADNKPSIEFHERGKNHKENVTKKISEIKQKSVAKAKADEKMSKEFAAMEEAALKAYEEDLKRLEGAEPASVAPVGPSIEERRARDEQKRREIEALEKHHAKRQWTKSFSPEGYPYFYNLLTGESQWEEPEGYHENSEEETKSTWIEGVSEEGFTYYYNSVTGESKWDKPEDFDNNLVASDNKKDSTDAKDLSAEDEQDAEEGADPEVTTDSTSEESQPSEPSEDATQSPTVAQTAKLNFRTEKENKPESDEESDTESKQEAPDERKDPSPQPAIKKPAKANPYGTWETVQEEEDPYENVDLELPNVEYCDSGVSVPDVEQEPKVKFKEKTITSLGDAAGAPVFKRRKLENVKSRNIRQRLNDY